MYKYVICYVKRSFINFEIDAIRKMLDIFKLYTIQNWITTFIYNISSEKRFFITDILRVHY